MGRTIATARLYASIVWLVVACVLAAIRESLPDDESTAGAFWRGLLAGFAVQWAMLAWVTVAHYASSGGVR